MRLTDEAARVVIANYGQGIISIDDFPQFNEKFVECLCRVLFRTVVTTGGKDKPGVAVSEMNESNIQGMVYYI